MGKLQRMSEERMTNRLNMSEMKRTKKREKSRTYPLIRV